MKYRYEQEPWASWCGTTHNREFKISRRWAPRKRRLKLIKFAFFQSLSRLIQLIYFVKCKRTLFEPNSKEPCSSSEREGKFSRHLFTSSIKRGIKHFRVVAVQWRQRNVQKRSAELLFWLFNLLLYWSSRCRRRHDIFFKSLFKEY